MKNYNYAVALNNGGKPTGVFATFFNTGLLSVKRLVSLKTKLPLESANA